MRMVYTRTPRRNFRWIFGLVIFVLGMTLTLSEAYGFSNPPGKRPTNNPGPQNPGTMNDQYCFSDPDILPDGPTDDDTPPPQVPEPGTLILLGSGLAAAYAARRKKS